MAPERIRRYDDERLYQPRIHSRRIRELHRISEETGEPMTVLVDHALSEFIEQHNAGSNQKDEKPGGGEEAHSVEGPEKRSQI